MAAVTLSPGMQVVALKIQEAGMMHGDVRSRLSDAINDAHRGSGNYGYYVDHSGDGESGDVIYSSNGDIRKAPYELGNFGGKATANIDMDNSTNVVPMTSYQEEADDDDMYASMEEAYKRDGLYTSLPLYERFISKKERDSADEGDFAGKGKSFPILQPGDVQAAVHAMGRAGDKNVGTSTLKSRIIAIAKRKGWTKYLPKAWQGGGDSTSTSESVTRGTVEHGTLKLIESVAFPLDLELREAFAVGKKVKLIAPGPGSSAYYTEEALKQAVQDKIFHAGLPMRIDHPTKAEEAARPEGSVKDWGAVLASDAVWLESNIGKDGKDSGKGIYTEIKPFSDHAQTIQEKGPYAGVSIRANGNALMEAGKPVMKDGRVVVAKFTSAEGADMVTRAGAGGMFLSESARAANQQEVDMTEAEVKKLLEAERSKWENEGALRTVKILEAKALRADAMVEAMKVLSGMSLHESAKARVLETVTRDGAFPVKEGAVEVAAFKLLVVAEAQREGEYLSRITGGGRVTGMGIGSHVELTEAQREEQRKFEKRQRKEAQRMQESDIDVFADLMGDRKAAERAALKVVA